MKSMKSFGKKFMKINMAMSSKWSGHRPFKPVMLGSSPTIVTIILNKEDLPMIVSMKSCSEDNPPERMGS